MRLPLAVVAVALGAIIGCQALPDVSWAPDDAGGDDASVPPPGDDAASGTGDDATLTPDAETTPTDATVVDSEIPAKDAGPRDAGSDAKLPPLDAGVDALPALGCPGFPPLGASYCCGATPCSGDAGACAPMCTNCENDCKMPGGICCLDGNGNYHGCALDCSTL